MKILYFYPEIDGNFMFSWQRVHFIDELKKTGINFEIINPLSYNSLIEAQNALLERIKDEEFDLFFSSAPLFLNEEIIRSIKDTGIPSLCFRPDNLLIPFLDIKIAKCFDLVWLTSKETSHLYEKWGAKYIFLPYAANPFTFSPNWGQPIKKIGFVGTPYGSRSNMINYIVRNNLEIDVYCKKNADKKMISFTEPYKAPSMTKSEILFNNLRFKEGRKVLFANALNRLQKHRLEDKSEYLSMLPKVPFEEINSIYSSYALSLSSTSARNTDILSKPVNVVNLRAFEIPMSGGLQFCRYSDELASYFEEDKEIVFYRNNEELVDKASFYTQKAPDSLISSMKAAARKRAESEHTWMHRFSKAFDILGLKY